MEINYKMFIAAKTQSQETCTLCYYLLIKDVKRWKKNLPKIKQIKSNKQASLYAIALVVSW
jgi:hypothetical protein